MGDHPTEFGQDMTKQKTPYSQTVENEILREHQRVLIDLARYASETEDLQRFLDDAVVRVAAAVEIDHVKVLRYRPAQGDLVIDAGVGWNPSSLKAVSFATDLASPPGRALPMRSAPCRLPMISFPQARADRLSRSRRI
jgi:hypothetical protein